MMYTEYEQAQAYPHSKQVCKLCFLLLSVRYFQFIGTFTAFCHSSHTEPDFTDFTKGLRGPVRGENVQKKTIKRNPLRQKALVCFAEQIQHLPLIFSHTDT